MNLEKGAPNSPGIYWFNAGHREGGHLIAQVNASTTYVFGDYGSMPLSSVYHEKLAKKAKHMAIALPKDNAWEPLNPKNVGSCKRAWVKSSDGYLGFALLRNGGNCVSADVVWVNHPQCASGSGMSVDDGYEFAPVTIPKEFK